MNTNLIVLRKALEFQVVSREELGAIVYVEIEDRAAVDRCMDNVRTHLWNDDTEVCAFSVTKCLTNLAVLLLDDGGLLDLDARTLNTGLSLLSMVKKALR